VSPNLTRAFNLNTFVEVQFGSQQFIQASKTIASPFVNGMNGWDCFLESFRIIDISVGDKGCQLMSQLDQ
jgi:hypothetical protein